MARLRAPSLLAARSDTAKPTPSPVSSSPSLTPPQPSEPSQSPSSCIPGGDQVSDEPGVRAFPGLRVILAQHDGRMDGAHDQSPPGPEGCVLHFPLVVPDPEPRAEHGLARYRAEQHEQPGPDEADLGVQPESARLDLGAVRALVDPALATRGPLEVLDRVAQVDLRAVDAGLAQRPVQDPPGGPDERTSLLVLLIAGLLTDEHHRPGGRPALPEHGRRRALVQVAARARGRAVRQFLPGGHDTRLPGRQPLTPARRRSKSSDLGVRALS